MIYYEILSDGTVGRSTNNKTVAEMHGYYNEKCVVDAETDIVYGYDNKRYLKDAAPQKPQTLIDAEAAQLRISELIQRLEELTKDFAQVQAGLIIEDIEDRKKEFQILLNEVRVLQGKEPRQIIS